MTWLSRRVKSQLEARLGACEGRAECRADDRAASSFVLTDHGTGRVTPIRREQLLKR